MHAYYNEEENIFFDSKGVLLINIFKWITPNELCLFKKKKRTKTVRVNRHIKCVLLYPHDDIYERRGFYTQSREEFIDDCKNRYTAQIGVSEDEWVGILLVDYDRVSA